MAAKHRKPKSLWGTDEVRRDQRRTCPVSGKRMYANDREAKTTAAHRTADKEASPTQLRTYKCLYYGAWHLTSKET